MPLGAQSLNQTTLAVRMWLQTLLHELRSLARTRRAAMLLLLYLGAAMLGGLAYVRAVQIGQERAASLLEQTGASPEQAEQAVKAALAPLRARMLAGAAEAAGAPIAQSLSTDLLLPVYLWTSLAFLPFLILLTSFDILSVDLDKRTLTYRTLRVSRGELLLGKVAAHALVFAGVSAIAGLFVIALAGSMLDVVDVPASLRGLARIWTLLLPFALCYLAMGTFCSSTTGHALVSLVLALAIASFLRLLGLAALFTDDHPLSYLQPLKYLSPAHYQTGLWVEGFTRPALSALAYLGFAAAFLSLARLVLNGRDLWASRWSACRDCARATVRS